MEAEKKEFGKWWVWVLCLIVFSVIVFGGLRAVGLIGSTIVERKVFENSFQYSEARKSEIATFEAQLAMIQGKLLNTNLEKNTRFNLEAQKSAIIIQLNVARRK